MDEQGIKPTTIHRITMQNEYNTYLYHICGKTLGSMDMLKRHLNSHTDGTYKYPKCTYNSLRMDAVRRHLSRHKTDQELPRPSMATRLETKPYQATAMYTTNNAKKQRGFPMNTTRT